MHEDTWIHGIGWGALYENLATNGKVGSILSFYSCLNFPTTVKTVLSGISGEKGCRISQFSGYQKVMPNGYRGVSSNLMDRPNPFCYIMSCPGFLAVLSISLSSLLNVTSCTHNVKKNTNISLPYHRAILHSLHWIIHTLWCRHFQCSLTSFYPVHSLSWST